ncbi:MAG: hypothetical protein H6772_01860 [Pseudomonadales bacterium]|nr:hypothetical protein [Pseudomonadales bacterium]
MVEEITLSQEEIEQKKIRQLESSQKKFIPLFEIAAYRLAERHRNGELNEELHNKYMLY